MVTWIPWWFMWRNRYKLRENHAQQSQMMHIFSWCLTTRSKKCLSPFTTRTTINKQYKHVFKHVVMWPLEHTFEWENSFQGLWASFVKFFLIICFSWMKVDWLWAKQIGADDDAGSSLLSIFLWILILLRFLFIFSLFFVLYASSVHFFTAFVDLQDQDVWAVCIQFLEKLCLREQVHCISSHQVYFSLGWLAGSTERMRGNDKGLVK